MAIDAIARGLAARANTAAGISAAGGALLTDLTAAKPNTVTLLGNSEVALCRATDGSTLNPWIPGTVYSLSDTVKPTHDWGAGANNQLKAQCTVAGTSAANYGLQPAWPTTVGATVTDGTVTWTMVAPNSTNLYYSANNWWQMAMALMGHPLDTLTADGLSSRKVADVVQRLPFHFALTPAYIACGGWLENDIANFANASEYDVAWGVWQTGILSIIARNITPIIFTPLPYAPGNNAVRDTGFRYLSNKVREFARDYSSKVLFVDWGDVYVDPATGVSPLSAGTIWTDGIHPLSRGAFVLAKRIKREIGPLLAPRPLFSTGGASDTVSPISNGNCYGTGGSTTTGATGAIPAQMTLNIFTNPTGGTATAVAAVGSKVARTDNLSEWEQVVVTGSGSGTVAGATAQLSSANATLPGSFFPAGSVVECFSEIKILANPTDLRYVSSRARLPAASVPLDVYSFFPTSQDLAIGGLITEDTTFVVRTPKFRLSTPTGNFSHISILNLDGLANPAITAQFGRSVAVLG